MHRSVALTILGVLAATSSPAEPPRLTLDRLYSLPNLIGTAPTGFAWSGDGRHLAFLWNDEGYNFRDVWVIDVDDPEGEPRRVTRMAQGAPETDGSDPVAAANAAERRERHPGVSSIAWHPDGQSILVGFAGDLWLAVAGEAPSRLTETDARESRAAYSPEGSALAFWRGGDLWRLDVGSTEAARLTDFAEADVRLVGYRWSPDGSRLAVVESDRRDVPKRFLPDYRADFVDEEPVLREMRRAYAGEPAPRQRVGVLAADGGEIHWIDLDEPAPAMILDYRWAPDGERLAVDTSDLYAKDRRIYVVDLAGEEPPSARVVVRENDPLNETFYFWRIDWSVDSRRLYFLSDREDDYHLWAVDPSQAAAVPVRLTQGAWAVADLHPVAGGAVVVGNRGNAEERHLFRVDDDGGEAVQLSIAPGTHSPTISPDGRHAASAFSNDATPPDLLLIPLGAERDERRVTWSPLPEFSQYRWVTPQYESFESHVDGTTLHGRLTLPPDFDPSRSYPAILGSVYTDSVRNQWGGRTAHPTWGLDQYLAQEGYILLNVDMRGSWGRGREHRRGIRLDYGGMDIEDLESGVRFLATLGYVDMDRVGIWGSSYGGLMTAMSLFRKPGLYAAGIAGAPATNVWHALTGQMAVMMRPEDQPEEYADSSPFLHAHGLEDPLMIIHGMRDWIVLYKDSLALVQRLIMLDKDVDLVTLPNAGHGWDNEGLAQTRFAFRKMVDFFDRHLLGAAEQPE